MYKHINKRNWVLLCVLALLALLTGGNSGLSASAGGPHNVVTPSLALYLAQTGAPSVVTGTVQATLSYTETVTVPTPPDAPISDPVLQELLNKGGFFTPDVQVDNGSNLFEAYIRNTGGDAQGKVYRVNPAGQVTGNWDVRVGSINGIAHKADGISLTISGPNVLALLSSHATNEGPRIMALWEASLDNVAVPYPDGVRATGKPGAFNGSQPAADIDYARIQAMIDGSVNRAVAQLQATLPISDGLQLRSELTRAGVLTLGNVYGSAGLYQRINETSYQATGNQLEERGIYRVPTRTPVPTPTATRTATRTP
jgi:hypothetical protein